MYFTIRSSYEVSVLLTSGPGENCEYCNRRLASQNFVNNSVVSNKLRHAFNSKTSRLANQWPMSIGGNNCLIIHEKVAAKFMESKLTGFVLHELFSIGGEMLDRLPCPPTYFRVESLGKTCFIPSPDEFEIGSCICMTEKKEFCDFKKPFVISPEMLPSEDFFKVYPYQFFTCVSRRVIEILIKNNWVNDFIIGDRALPGMRIKEFGANWYGDTLEQLKRLFPDSTILE